jgi:peptide/nickel transport system permease protein
MIMPVLALALGPVAVLARYVRSSMLETLREEYVTAAFAKGGPYSTVVIRHALRNSLIPLVTVVGPLLAGLMTGTVFVETLFRIPGLGLYFTQAAASRDMPLLMGTTLFFALILMVVNLIVDLIYGALDPRIRVEAARGRGFMRGGRKLWQQSKVQPTSV